MIHRSYQVLVATGFILLLLAQQYASTLQYINYLVNRASFEAHCENKAKPALKCHGKCQLKKQQQATEQQQPTASLPEKREVNLTAFALPFTWRDFTFTPSCRLLPSNKALVTTSPDCRGYLSDVFHPPCA